MQEVPRIGIPNLLSQVELLARSRGSIGAEVAMREQVVQAIARQSDERAAELSAVKSVDGTTVGEREAGGGEAYEGHHAAGEHRPGGDAEPAAGVAADGDGIHGSLIDVRA